MCACGLAFACAGNCSCGCGHNGDSFVSWNLGYHQGRKDASAAISRMRDVDEVCMSEIESDPNLDETYILVRRVDAEKVAMHETQIG